MKATFLLKWDDCIIRVRVSIMIILNVYMTGECCPYLVLHWWSLSETFDEIGPKLSYFFGFIFRYFCK